MNKEALLRAFMEEIWNQKKVEKLANYIHEAYTIHLDTADPWEGKTLSHADFKERLRYSFDSFPDMHFEITSAITEENYVGITWVLTGTNLGKIGAYDPTNNRIRTNGMTIYHFKDELICGHTQVFDRVTVMQQLGFA